jgi:Ribbon-helix-helix domain
MQATIDQQTQEKIKQVSEETGIPEPEVLDRALDMLLLTEEMHGLRDLKDDMDFWQQRYLDTLALEDERIATLDYDQGGPMGH